MMQKEQKKIESVVAKETLIKALRYVGLSQNMNVEVHASLSSLGYMIGGARAVVDALMEIITGGGTILMPTHNPDNSDPSSWVNPPASPMVWQEIRDNMPAYNPQTSDPLGMGAISDNFRKREGVLNSNHPSVSFAAWGRYARVLCNRQSLHFPLAEESPIARLYELKGHVLLIGTDLSSATCLHLAEYRTECRPIIIRNTCTLVDGRRGWKKYLDLDIDSSDFEKLRPEMDRRNLIKETTLNGCRIQLFQVSAAVDTATEFFEKNIVYDLYR